MYNDANIPTTKEPKYDMLLLTGLNHNNGKNHIIMYENQFGSNPLKCPVLFSHCKWLTPNVVHVLFELCLSGLLTNFGSNEYTIRNTPKINMITENITVNLNTLWFSVVVLYHMKFHNNGWIHCNTHVKFVKRWFHRLSQSSITPLLSTYQELSSLLLYFR